MSAHALVRHLAGEITLVNHRFIRMPALADSIKSRMTSQFFECHIEGLDAPFTVSSTDAEFDDYVRAGIIQLPASAIGADIKAGTATIAVAADPALDPGLSDRQIAGPGYLDVVESTDGEGVKGYKGTPTFPVSAWSSSSSISASSAAAAAMVESRCTMCDLEENAHPAALHSVQTSVCEICLDDDIKDPMTFPGCGHTCCTVCWNRFFESALSEGSPANVACFHFKCAAQPMSLLEIRPLVNDTVKARIKDLLAVHRAHTSQDTAVRDMGVDARWMECPNCSILVGRTDGCNCMTHDKCRPSRGPDRGKQRRTYFCYCCGMILRDQLASPTDIQGQMHFPFGPFKPCRIAPPPVILVPPVVAADDRNSECVVL